MVTSEGLIQVIKVNLRVPFMFSWCYHDFLSFWRFDLWKLACEWNAVLSPADPPFYRSCDKIFNQTNHNYLRGQSFTFNWTMCAKCRTRILVKFRLVFKVDQSRPLFAFRSHVTACTRTASNERITSERTELVKKTVPSLLIEEHGWTFCHDSNHW